MRYNINKNDLEKAKKRILNKSAHLNSNKTHTNQNLPKIKDNHPHKRHLNQDLDNKSASSNENGYLSSQLQFTDGEQFQIYQ